jgi:hypothetical protein
MIKHFVRLPVVLLLAAALTQANAETLRDRVNNIFVEVLELQLSGSPGNHANHFRPSNVATSGKVISAFENFVGTNASAYPLSSTTAGLTFDLSSGVPVATTTSAGPIFAERATTLGRKKLNVGFNASYLNLDKFRGIDTQNMRLTFLHQDVGDPGLGDATTEYDYIDLQLNMDIKVSVLATYATYGITDRLDLGVAIPFVSVKINSTPFARMNSYTYEATGSALHFWGGTPTDPVLTLSPTPINNSSTGIGDIAIRAKYHFYDKDGLGLGVLGEAKLPTGKEDDFLGTGSAAYRVMLIASGTVGSLSPHANLGFNLRTGDLERNEFLLTLGYDQKIGDKFTLAADWLGQFEVGSQLSQLTFPGPVSIGPTVDGSQLVTERVTPTNIPNFTSDNLMNTSFGVKYMPSPKVVLLANMMFANNQGGLRTDFMPTVGAELSF